MKTRHIVAVVSFLLVGTGIAGADEPSDLTEAIRIDRAVADASAAGGCTQARFRIANDSRRDVHLLGLTSEAAESTELKARTGPSSVTTIGSVSVPAGSVLDLTTSHLWYELCLLKRPLRPGDRLVATLDFVSWKVPVELHVH